MSKFRPILFFGLLGVLVVATSAAFRLSLKEFNTAGSCPILGPVPACYLVLAGFAAALVGHLAGKYQWGRILFLLGLGFPTLLAIIASIGESAGFIECPKTSTGVPMCYLSLAICILAWIFWRAGGSFNRTFGEKG
tara:strand:- start:610 stop:1017 length:408 start_codon:yes stop_codon:yes gene_type:complete